MVFNTREDCHSFVAASPSHRMGAERIVPSVRPLAADADGLPLGGVGSTVGPGARVGFGAAGRGRRARSQDQGAGACRTEPLG